MAAKLPPKPQGNINYKLPPKPTSHQVEKEYKPERKVSSKNIEQYRPQSGRIQRSSSAQRVVYPSWWG